MSIAAFTDLELKVIPWLPSLLSFADIADRLGLSAALVKLSAIGVYRKLGVVNRREAVAKCERLGLLARSSGSATTH